jgi:hypothetical protein
MKLGFSQQVFKDIQIHFTNVWPMAAKLFHADKNDDANTGIPQFCESAGKSACTP